MTLAETITPELVNEPNDNWVWPTNKFDKVKTDTSKGMFI